MEGETTELAPAPPASERIEEIFRAFEAKGAPHADAERVFIFELTGDDGGRHALEVGPTAVRWRRDYSGSGDVTVRLSVEDFLAIADGRFDGRLAVASERIEVTGDLDAAERLFHAFEAEEA